MTRGNGSKAHSQEELLLDAAQDAQAAGDPAAHPAGDPSTADDAAPAAGDPPAERSLAAELVSTLDGCWMVTRHGKRVELSDEEWRKELAHALARNRPPA